MQTALRHPSDAVRVEETVLRVLVTGGTSSQVNESTKRQADTLSGLFARALRSRGHEVDVRRFHVGDMVEDTTGADNGYDFAFVGQSPLRGLGSSYCYGALAAQQRFDGKYAIFTDDADTRKMSAEWRVALQKPADFVKPFWHYKRDWETARSRAVLPALLGQIEKLIGSDREAYPRVFVPAWTYDLAFVPGVALSPWARNAIYGCDPTPWVETSNLTRTEPDPDGRYWGTYAKPDSREVGKMGPRLWSVERVSRTTWKELTGASGFMMPGAVWAPEARIGLELGVPLVTDWRVMCGQFGEPFEALAANVEMLPQSGLDDLAAAQLEALEAKSSTREDLPDTLEKMIEETLGQ